MALTPSLSLLLVVLLPQTNARVATLNNDCSLYRCDNNIAKMKFSASKDTPQLLNFTIMSPLRLRTCSTFTITPPDDMFTLQQTNNSHTNNILYYYSEHANQVQHSNTVIFEHHESRHGASSFCLSTITSSRRQMSFSYGGHICIRLLIITD